MPLEAVAIALALVSVALAVFAVWQLRKAIFYLDQTEASLRSLRSLVTPFDHDGD